MFYSRFNRVLAGVTWLLCAGAIAAVFAADFSTTFEFLPLIALVAWFAFCGLWRPALTVTDDGVTIRNVFATTVVPWAALIQVDTRYALTLVTPRGRHTVTAAPAPGRLVTALSRRDMSGIAAPDGSDGGVRPGDLPNTDSGSAAYLVRQRWQALLQEDRIEVGLADETPIIRQPHWPVIVMSVILTVLAFATLALN